MDVLRPRLLNLDGRCYRVYPNKQSVVVEGFSDSEAPPVAFGHEDEGLSAAICDSDEQIEKIGENFKLFLRDIPSIYLKHIVGKKAETKRKIERETSTTITLPKRNTEGDLEICGKSRSGVLSAKTRIEVIVENARLHQVPTHFLALPIDSNAVHEKVLEFTRNVMRTCYKSRGVSADIFQLPERLHLTLGMVTINSVAERDDMASKLSDIFRRVQSQQSMTAPLTVEISGIEYMNDDPSEVDVLYAKLAESPQTERLSNFCKALIDECVSCGILKNEQRNLKLHITIMNSKFRLQGSGITDDSRDPKSHQDNQKQKKRVTFDARKITQMYKDYEFKSAELRSLVIATRGDFDQMGRFKNAFEIPFDGAKS